MDLQISRWGYFE